MALLEYFIYFLSSPNNHIPYTCLALRNTLTLGVKIDEKLLWKDRINNCKSICNAIHV